MSTAAKIIIFHAHSYASFFKSELYCVLFLNLFFFKQKRGDLVSTHAKQGVSCITQQSWTGHHNIIYEPGILRYIIFFLALSFCDF